MCFSHIVYIEEFIVLSLLEHVETGPRKLIVVISRQTGSPKIMNLRQPFGYFSQIDL